MKSPTAWTTLVLFFVVGLTSSAPPLDLKGKTLQQTFDELLPGMAARDGGKKAKDSPNDAQQRWQEICFQLGAPGNEARRGEACKLMAEKLGANTPTATRVWLLQQLQRIGRAECVDAVAGLLTDKDDLVREAAVRCLAHNPAPQATARLTASLPGATGKARLGLLNALGHRADPAALPIIVKELGSDDSAVVSAAAQVLGKLATPDAARALAAARPTVQGAARLAVHDALLRCADRRLQEGELGPARQIYLMLYQPEESRSTRLAALQGVLRTAGDQAGAKVLEILNGTDADARAIAVGQIEHLSSMALKPLGANLAKLPPASQVLVLHAIATRGDRAQVQPAVAALKSKEENVRRAAVQALGRLGGPSEVGVLLDTLFASPNLGDLAADSLAQLVGDGITEKLLAALDAEKSASRIGLLIGVLERRKAAAAVPALLKMARAGDAAVRASAFAGLRSLAEPKHVPEMVLALLQTQKGKERDQAEQAIVAVCSQIAEAEKRAEPVLAILKTQVEAKVALLPLLGRLGGPQALRVIREALAGSDPEQYSAALTGLCHWPEPSVSDDLLKQAEGAKMAGDRLRALQAVIRVNTASSDGPAEPRSAALRKAMELTTRDDERRAILEGLGMVRHIDTLRYVLPYLDHKTLSQSACKGIVELAHSRNLREPNKAEFDKALDRVIKLCKDKSLIERAKEYRQQ